LLGEARKWKKDISMDAMKATNLKFMPAYSLVFDEEAWLTFTRSWEVVNDLDENALLTQVKDWNANGVRGDKAPSLPRQLSLWLRVVSEGFPEWQRTAPHGGLS
jgi:hypothetical protein